MSCTDVASILDTHRSARLAPAERARVDAHLAACGDCAAAWHGHTELLALPMPAMPATLLERVERVSRARGGREPRRLRLPVVIGSALLAGAALAAGVTIVAVLRPPAESPAPRVGAAPQASPSAASLETLERVDSGRAAAQDERPTAVELVETALGIAPMIRQNPEYPRDALGSGAEGHVQLEFDVTAAGSVENVRVVESSDVRFEQSAVDALAAWRYLPRIAGGKRVRSDDVHTIIRFVLSGDTPPPDLRSEDERQEAAREYAAYMAGLKTALDRLAADDLRGVELQLDEMAALYGSERADLWSFYGYLYTVEGNYARAIDAYETAVGIALQSPRPTGGPYVPLANLYFARHQYDMALKTLLRPQQATNGAAPPGGSRRLGAEAEALLERLRALGVTEETL